MTKQFTWNNTAAAFDHTTTLVVSLELSSKSWVAAAQVPGVARRPRKRLEALDMAGLLETLRRWQRNAKEAGCAVTRVVLTYEAGRDGFWIARYLLSQGIEVHVMHAASVPVARGRRRKTDRLDLDLLLRSYLAWLRGEPGACSMVRIPSQDEEDRRQPSRELERLVSERVKLENGIKEALCRFGITDFRPRRKNAIDQLAELRCFDGSPLPDMTAAALRRLMARNRLVCDQIKEIESERDRVLTRAKPDRAERMIQLLAQVYGLGVQTATVLVREMFCRSFRDRRQLASYAGLTGTPFHSGGREREQGISKTGNAHVRRILTQLAWRWLRFQPNSALSLWYVERTEGSKRGRMRKIMIVALARKLLIALWRYLMTGELPLGARTKA